MTHGEPALRRVVRRWQILALALNDVIGSGVYLLPAAAAALLGPASLWAVLVAGLAVLLLVLCFAEAATYFEEPGGAYLYARTAFGDLAGLEVGWMTWLARVASVASLSAGFAVALGHIWPALAAGWPRAAAIVIPVLGISCLNILGIRAGVGASVFLVIVKSVPLILFVGAGLAAATWDRVALQPAGSRRLGEAALLLMFAYAGFENTPAAAGEYRNPRRDVPAALILNVVLVTLLYVSVQWVALGTLPHVGASETPLADAANLFMGGWAGLLMTFGAALSILGTNSNSTLSGPRYLLALARDGYGPAVIGRIHPKYRTPAAAIAIQAALALPMALSGRFEALAALSVIARLATYIGTAAAVPVLRRKMPRPPGAFRIPGGPAVPIAAAGISIALAASAGRSSLLAAGIALAAGLLLHRFRRPRRDG